MAIARFLDASDQSHAGGAFMAALMYFNGVGITRNTEEAKALAKRCIDLGTPSSLVKLYCGELVDGSIGTENVRRLIEQDEATVQQSDEQVTQKKKMVFGLMLAGAVAVLVAAVGGFFYLQAQDRLDAVPPGGIEGLIPKDEIAQARKDALAIISKLHADAVGAEGEGGETAQRGKDF